MVSPGIRPGHGDAIPQDDQKRVATAYQAILDGADHVVVGRPIRNAPDPLVMVKFIQQQIATAVAERQRLREI
ncbi:hypothetical protein TI04_11410 [Achromatium sp. WMS2]|nr:hypothetical protein TI04_11410 [Achromatium sp. WMS2]